MKENRIAVNSLPRFLTTSLLSLVASTACAQEAPDAAQAPGAPSPSTVETPAATVPDEGTLAPDTALPAEPPPPLDPTPPIATPPQSAGQIGPVDIYTPNLDQPDDNTDSGAQSTLAPPQDALVRPEFDLPSGIAAGQEAPGGSFSLESPNGVIYDMENGLALARGNVVFSYREFTVRADRGVVDYNTNRATMSNNLTVTARDTNGRQQTLRGQSLVFDLDSGRWTLSQLRATFPPEVFPEGQVLEPLYLRNGTVQGDYDNATGSDFQFSSCDRDHYHIQSKRITFHRDQNGNPDRIVLRRNSLYVFGNKILPLPVYVISLQGARSRRYGLQPTFGQNAVDGFFVRTVYDIAATNSRTDSLLVDALQKRGLGLGLQRELAGGAGLFYLYALSGRTGGREIDSRIRRNWQITPNLRSSLVFDSTQNNSLSGEGYAARNGQLNFDFFTSRVQSNLLLTQNSSSSPFSSFSQQNATFTHRQQLGGNWDVEADSLYARTRSTGQDELATWDNLFGLNGRNKRFDSFLRAELHSDLTNKQAYQLERLPELRLTSDTQRLGVPFLDRRLPGEISVALGDYNEPRFGSGDNVKLTRTMFDYNLQRREFRLINSNAARSELSVGAGFNQTLYSNDTARYQYAYDFSWNNFIGRRGEGRNAPLNFQVNYLKLRPVGYTPFNFDFVSPNEFVDVRGIFEPSRKLRLEVAGGRDLQNNVNRDITSTLRVAPSRQFNFDLSSSYSTERSQLNDVTGNFYVTRESDRFLNGSLVFAFRYNPQQSTFTTINTAGDIRFGRKTRLQFFTGYNGQSKQFDFQQFRVVRDIHCFNLFATYDNQRREFRVDLALKAFPFLDTRLGQTRFGEGFDPQVGAVR
jgi:hypothetical protein